MDQQKSLPATETVYVQSEELLDTAVNQIEKASEIAIDLEFDKDRFSYGSTVCLIQIFDGTTCWLIDSLAGFPLQPLFPALENPSIFKIMHSPGEDLQLLHLEGCFPKNIFDTERCARLLDFPSFSLSNLMLEFTGLPLDKSQQKTDWTRRPLQKAQLDYAARDVIHLPELKEKLLTLVNAKGIESWVKEENEAWERYRAEEKAAGQFTNKDDNKKLPPFHLYVFNALMGLRDGYARKMNKPGYQVITKEILMDMAFSPEIADQWLAMKGIHYSIKNNTVYQEIKSTLEKAMQEAAALNLPKRKASSSLTFEQRQEEGAKRKRADDIVDSTLRPVLQEIIARYGENAGAYMLNEKTMTEIVTGKLKISELPYTYRTMLIQSIATEKDIDLNLYC